MVHLDDAQGVGEPGGPSSAGLHLLFEGDGFSRVAVNETMYVFLDVVTSEIGVYD